MTKNLYVCTVIIRSLEGHFFCEFTCISPGFHLGISSWGGVKLTDHAAVRPWRGEGRLLNYNYWQYLGGGGGGGEVRSWSLGGS